LFFFHAQPGVETPYLFSVAAGVPPAVEPGILPGGLSCGLRRHFRVQSCQSGRQDAVLYGSQDGCRYTRKPTLNTYETPGYCQMSLRDNPALEPFRLRIDLRTEQNLCAFLA